MPTYTIDGQDIEAPKGMTEQRAQEIYEKSRFGRPTSTITGKPVQTSEEKLKQTTPLLANIVRFGGPITATAVTKNPGWLALWTGLSEYGALELEDKLSNTTYQSDMDKMLSTAQKVRTAATSAGLSYVGDSVLQGWAGKYINTAKNKTTRPLLKKTLGGIVRPKGEARRVLREPQRADRFLARLAPDAESRPYALTIGQQFQGRKNLWTETENFARSGWLSGRFKSGDIRNIQATNDYVTALMRSGSDMTPQQFGDAIQTLMASDRGYITLQKNKQFQQFRDAVYEKGVTVDFTAAFEKLTDQTDNRFVREILSKVAGSDPRVLQAMKGGDELMTLTDEAFENYFMRMPEASIQEFMDTLRQTIHEMPVENAADLRFNLNRMFGKSKESGIHKFTKEFKVDIDAAISKAVGQPNFQLLDDAIKFSARHSARGEKATIEAIWKTMGDNEKPGSIVSMFKGQGALDNYNATKRFFNSSDVLTMKEFDKTVRSPLRHKFLSDIVDPDTLEFSGDKLSSALNAYRKDLGPEFLSDLFGPDSHKVLWEAANTLSVLQKTKESNIVMKVLQASAMVGTPGTLIGYGTGIVDAATLAITLGGVTALALFPRVASKFFASPTLLRTLIDGVAAGPGTGKFARAVMVTTTQNRKYLRDQLPKMSIEAQEFYDNLLPPDTEQEQFTPPIQTLGDIPGTAGMYFPETPLM